MAIIAQLAGVDRADMAEFVEASLDDKPTWVLLRLSQMTGIYLSWLFAESTAGAEPGE